MKGSCASGIRRVDFGYHVLLHNVRPWFVWCSVIAVVLCAPAAAQISPGPLSGAHQQLEGVGKCTSCHALGSNKGAFKCLDCHVEIRRRVEARAGMHARAYRDAQGTTDCARCHMEHNGQSYSLVRLDRNNFDHAAQTGFTLQGKHRAQRCENCHNPARIAAGAREEIKIKNLNRTFLGLQHDCLSCHEDQHRGQLGSDCTRCHSQDGWKPAAGFNHASARFQLTGLHQGVACLKCHIPPPGGKAGAFKGLNFSGCQSCHTDPHRGAFQDVKTRPSCESCHNTGGWKNNRPGTNFDHGATRFALAGKHAAQRCSPCHKNSDFHRTIAHDRCQDCHKDPHTGQFAARASGSDCSSCHSENGFKPTRFDRDEHGKSAFPLEGKHADVACDKCHQPAGPSTVYKTGKLVCSACHADKHRGQFDSAPYYNRCELCHTVAGFKPDTFSVERHAKTQFPLIGHHASATCRDCHKAVAETRQFHFDSRACNTCHADPHETKLACETCHTPQQWKPAGPYEHPATQFRLEGAHLKVECIQCHRAAQGGADAKPKPPVFARTPHACASCHAAKDPHGGQFTAVAGVEDCSNCHVTTRWSGTDFEHDRARFALDVAHRRVACEKCHKNQSAVGTKLSRIYRGTPVECVRCH